MEEHKNYLIKNNIKYSVFKYFTFIILICIWNPKNDVGIFPNLSENKYVEDITMNIIYNRLLAKHELKQELKYEGLGEKLSEGNIINSKKYIAQNVSKFSQLKGIKANNFDNYMKDYNRRYAKKKGLFKLDCYCENKVFKKFNNICDIGKKMQYDEKRWKNFFLKKYGIGIIIFALFPALGLIFPILFGDEKLGGGILDYCLSDKHKDNQTHTNCNATNIWYKHKETIENIGSFSYIFFSIFGVIVSLVFIYILIKVIKYERLKAGRGKLCVKEYGRFAKDVFI